MHCHHKIRTQNAYRNIPRGKKQRACLHFTSHQLTDCSAHAKVTGLTYLVDRAGALDKYDVTDGYSMSTPMTPTRSSGHYLRNRSTLDTGVLGYIGIV